MENLLQEFSEKERTAYLGAIASIATADHHTSEEESNFLKALIQTSGLSPSSEEKILQAAKDNDPETLKAWLNDLKESELKFSLIADLIAFAASDKDYSESEKNAIQQIASALNVNEEQYNVLNEFVAEAENMPAAALQKPEQAMGFFDTSGLGSKMNNAGINMGSVSKGLLSVIAPLLISKLFSKSGSSSGGGLGDLIGGFRKAKGGNAGLGDLISGIGGSKGGGGISDLIGGLINSNSGGGGTLADLLGGNSNKKGGGLGDLISGLGGNKGFGNSGKLIESLFK